ncbi:MAG: rubrerythrin, partial [Celeribacter sp.]
MPLPAQLPILWGRHAFELFQKRSAEMIPGFAQRKRFSDLSEQDILALAISSEEDDARIYRTYAHELRDEFPSSAAIFDDMAREEDSHRSALIDLHQKRF